ncbi:MULTISPECIES: LacI family DNA-binding transcriptional regulator [Burkholderiaceae]|uniref:Transcriptional regulator, LacI family n=1 Tax=Paraburkholderia phytofirmans (strain DSM 17436 / LMG 22146 / PsJN) TaxID=398527 RepID=B2SZD4_PARPJ|nr:MULTISPECIES: LacI family DNA-binding transcriptional regulator [Burkholderiaceae]HEP6277580.1 LacI family DNA-binding transcriptional regulator [Burkholderia vietnamiensis]ACD14513.1 transcriptional regulator, LacI family [Paraburkholderia phytofirmans PsJN]MBR8394003.1 LacI family DNA-binding transcriptional regulator [Burkholderia cenocepacia]MBR8473040.1 LacI family DNA-binding transcriptional regulator [Burkholderia cenocepacia]MBR8491920.1 LacI family DNA-binding transcriptional regul
MDHKINSSRSGAKKKATMQDVATLAGVAPMTVSNCYRVPDKVHPQTLARVLEAAAKLGYTRNRIAGNLASGRSQVVGVLVPSLENSNFIGMIQGLEDRLHQLDHQLMLAVTPTADRELDSIRTFIERRIDGVVLTDVQHSRDTVDLLRNARLPTVETWSLKGPFIDMGVGFSLYDAAFDMTNLMIEAGYRRIGFAGFTPASTERFLERQRGFEDALRRANLRHDVHAYTEQSEGFAGGRITLNALLREEPELDGVFCGTDILAAGMIFECMRRGWRVPGRIGIAGYGNYQIASEITPKLTTVATPGYEMGVAAAEMLVGRLVGAAPAPVIRDVGYRLISGASF